MSASSAKVVLLQIDGVLSEPLVTTLPMAAPTNAGRLLFKVLVDSGMQLVLFTSATATEVNHWLRLFGFHGHANVHDSVTDFAELLTLHRSRGEYVVFTYTAEPAVVTQALSVGSDAFLYVGKRFDQTMLRDTSPILRGWSALIEEQTSTADQAHASVAELWESTDGNRGV